MNTLNLFWHRKYFDGTFIGLDKLADGWKCCHGMPHLPCLHTPNHLRSSLTPSAYTLVSLQCTLHKLAQPHHSCGWTKLGSMSNFPGLSPYVSGCHLFVFFSICCICLMHFH